MRFAIYTLLIILVLPWAGSGEVRADDFSGSGPMTYRQRQSQAQPSILSANVLRIINTSNRTSEYTLRISAASGFQILGQRERSFTLAAGDTLFIPVRVIPSSQLQSTDPQPITASLFRFGSLLATADWFITPIIRSEWTAAISRQQVLLPSEADTVMLRVRIANPGNLNEILTLRINLAPDLALTNALGEVLETREYRIPLRARSDTVIPLYIRLPQRSASGVQQTHQRKTPLRVRISVNSETTTSKSWGSNVEIRRLESLWKQNQTPYRSIPLTAEFQAYDLFGKNSYGSLALYGRHVFANNDAFSYYLQSNYTSTFLNPQSFLGQYLHLHYQSKHFGVELGNVSQNNEGANVSGEGAKVWGTYGPHRLGVAYMAMPGLFDQSKMQQSMAAEYLYTGADLRAGAWVQQRENFLQKTDDQIAGAWASYRFMKSQFIRLSASVSQQQHRWNPDSIFETEGLGFTVNYTGRAGKFAYNAMFSQNSPSHLVRRGTQNLSSRVSWRVNRKNQLFVSYLDYQSDPEVYFRGELRELNLLRKRQIYRLGWQNTGEFSSLSLQPIHEQYLDPWLQYHNSGIEAEYRLLDFHHLRFFSGATAGFTQLQNTELLPDPFFVGRVRASLRYFQYALNLRYYFGPYYSNEIRRYAEEDIRSNRFSAGFNFDQDLLQGTVLFRLSTLYNYTTYNQQSVVSLRPEVFYFPQAGLRFGVYARYYGLSAGQQPSVGIPDLSPGDLTFSSSRFEFGFSIRKDFNVPVSGKRFYDLNVVVYRDLSATGTMDRNDPGVPDIWVRLQAMEVAGESSNPGITGMAYEAITGRDGKAMFVNIAPGHYLLSLIPVAQASSRHETRTMEVIVTQDQTLYVSIDRGARVAGSISLERDAFTRAEYFPLGGIRVTATNNEGQQFSTLTSEGGQYSLYLPRGSYRISINENVFGQDFQLQQNNIPIEVLHPQEIISINFLARERARQIRIQQPANDRAPREQEQEQQNE